MSIKLELNQPFELALTRPDPKVYQNTGRPPSHMYSIVMPDGTEDKLFLSPKCSETISELRIQPRETFSICRRKTPQGVEYFEVNTLRESQTSRKLAAAPQTAAATETQERKPQTRANSLMGSALIAAIDAASEAQRYAMLHGIEVEFGPADLRAIAATLYIQACKERQIVNQAA